MATLRAKANRIERQSWVCALAGVMLWWAYPEDGGRTAGAVLLLIAALLSAWTTSLRLQGSDEKSPSDGEGR